MTEETQTKRRAQAMAARAATKSASSAAEKPAAKRAAARAQDRGQGGRARAGQDDAPQGSAENRRGRNQGRSGAEEEPPRQRRLPAKAARRKVRARQGSRQAGRSEADHARHQVGRAARGKERSGEDHAYGEVAGGSQLGR